MAERPLLVTLDGPAGVGKSVLAKRVAETLGIAYLDSGAMFRAVAWKLGDGAWEIPESELAERLRAFSFELRGAGGDSRLLLNGDPLSGDIRTETVGMWASNIAVLPVVRAFQREAQQAIGRSTPLVAEGRDMGTVVFPEAPCKFFLDATPGERARRRWLQLKEMGRDPGDLAGLEEQIRRRDDQDRNRKEAPLRPAADAHCIDTTSIGLDEVFARILEHIPR